MLRTAQLSGRTQSGLRHAQRHQRRGFVAGRPLPDQRRRQPAVHREPGANPPHSRRAIGRGGAHSALRTAAQRRVPDPGWRRSEAARDRGGVCHTGLLRNHANPGSPRPRVPGFGHGGERPGGGGERSLSPPSISTARRPWGIIYRAGRSSAWWAMCSNTPGFTQNHGPISVEPTLYSPASQTSDGAMQLIHTWFSPKWVIRASGPTGSLAAQIQRAVASVDSQLPIASFQTIDDLQAQITSSQRYRAALFSIFAGAGAAAGGRGDLRFHLAIHHAADPRTRRAHGAGGQRAADHRERDEAGDSAGVAGRRRGIPAVAAWPSGSWNICYGACARPIRSLSRRRRAILLLAAALASLAPALRILRLDPAQTLRNE